MLDSATRLRYAVAGTRFGGGGARLAAKVRRVGLGAFDEVLQELTSAQAREVDESAERLLGHGVGAMLLGDDYPSSLAECRDAPPVLFVNGPQDLLNRPAIGTCGSRHADDNSLRAARACGEVIVEHGFTLVSGYARGVDMASHISALERGGTTVIVLPEGIERFTIRQGEFSEQWDSSRCVVVSQFSPSQPWSAGAAMARNSVISGLSRALVVVEAGEKGGTLAAGTHALDKGQPVLVLDLGSNAAGNQILLSKGATPVRNRQEFASRIADLPTNGTAQLTLI